jgi:hypothetical protein
LLCGAIKKPRACHCSQREVMHACSGVILPTGLRILRVQRHRCHGFRHPEPQREADWEQVSHRQAGPCAELLSDCHHRMRFNSFRQAKMLALRRSLGELAAFARQQCMQRTGPVVLTDGFWLARRALFLSCKPSCFLAPHLSSLSGGGRRAVASRCAVGAAITGIRVLCMAVK